MLEAKIEKAELLKKVLDAVKELVTDANWDCDEGSMKLQAMDNSHIALVSLELNRETFVNYRCDRNMSLGMNLASLTKILKCAGNDDSVKISASDDSDVLGLDFQNRKADRMAQYEMKLMDIDQEHLGIPDTSYDAQVTMPSSEFSRIVRDIKELGESVKIEVTKEGIKFSAEGDIGSAAVTLRPTTTSTRQPDQGNQDDEDEEMADKVKSEEEDEVEVVGQDDDEEDEDGSVAQKKKKKATSKKQAIQDSDDEEGGDGEGAVVDDEDEDVKPEVTEIDSGSEGEGSASTAPARKRKAAATNGKSTKKAKTAESKKGKSTTTKAKTTSKKKKSGDGDDEENREIVISLAQAVSLTFSIKYLTSFAKSTPLSNTVNLYLSAEVPLLVQYEFTGGVIKFYLAPKISDD